MYIKVDTILMSYCNMPNGFIFHVGLMVHICIYRDKDVF